MAARDFAQEAPRRVVITGLGMIAERVADGTTPNVGMIMGAVGAAFTMWMKTHGDAPAADGNA